MQLKQACRHFFISCRLEHCTPPLLRSTWVARVCRNVCSNLTKAQKCVCACLISGLQAKPLSITTKFSVRPVALSDLLLLSCVQASMPTWNAIIHATTHATINETISAIKLGNLKLNQPSICLVIGAVSGSGAEKCANLRCPVCA